MEITTQIHIIIIINSNHTIQSQISIRPRILSTIQNNNTNIELQNVVISS